MDAQQDMMGFMGGEAAAPAVAFTAAAPVEDGQQYVAPAMAIPDGIGNPIAQTMDMMDMGGYHASPAEDPFAGMPASNAGMGMQIPEMTKLREWETKHEEELEDTGRKEEAAKRQTRESAAQELAKWYQEREADMAKRGQVNRAQEQEMEAGRLAALKPDANPWERVVDLIDTNSRTADESRDTSRMRALLIQLKNDPVVTAAA